jgi:hypothetical protein
MLLMVMEISHIIKARFIKEIGSMDKNKAKAFIIIMIILIIKVHG